MSNKTFIPAFQAHVGDWQYFMCIMKYAEIARSVQFAYELGGNRDLATMIQRGITNRTKDITEYLLHSEHRFLGSMIIATYGGNPEYTPLSMVDSEGILKGVDREFGVLTLDGSQQFFALDGQHRLRAIKDALIQNPELGAEDICVLLVPHFDTEKGRIRTRRLFTNINRNAKSTTASENIALDEDYGISIITREFLYRHPFLRKDGVVRVFVGKPSGDGELKLAGNSIPKTDPKAWTTLSVLHDMLEKLASDGDQNILRKDVRPSNDDIEKGYDFLSQRIDDLFNSCGSLGNKLKQTDNARKLRAPVNNEGKGHPFMRPVVQKSICRVLANLLDQERITWPDAMARLLDFDWTISKDPWLAIFNAENNKIVSSKDNSDLLDQLLSVHLAPSTKSEIKRARKNYKDILGRDYSFSESALEVNLK